MHIDRNPAVLAILMRLVVEARFSQAWLSHNRGRYAAADPVLEAFLNAMEGSGSVETPFYSRKLPRTAFHQSPAYRNMVELGLSPDEMESALGPYRILD